MVTFVSDSFFIGKLLWSWAVENELREKYNFDMSGGFFFAGRKSGKKNTEFEALFLMFKASQHHQTMSEKGSRKT